MGAAESESPTAPESEPEPEFTPRERAKIRVLLDLLDRAGRVDRQKEVEVREPAPTPEDFAELRARKRRREHRHG